MDSSLIGITLLSLSGSKDMNDKVVEPDNRKRDVVIGAAMNEVTSDD